MGAAWKKFKDGKDLETVVKMIKTVKSLDLEACVTLGSITKDQAKKLKDAGLDAYNHNIDTSPEFYKEIITTRSFEERLETLNNVRHAGINVCSGGILGMGETWDDRAKMLKILSDMDPQPESVPINALVPVKGTPLQNQKRIDSIEIVRVIATARIICQNHELDYRLEENLFLKKLKYFVCYLVQTPFFMEIIYLRLKIMT